MSTRGSFGFINNNKEYLFSNYSDSYPGGLGYDILKICVDISTNDEWNICKNDTSILYEKLQRISRRHDLIVDNDYIKDSLFCEHAYIINLDTLSFEYYVGFQLKPQLYNRFGYEKKNDYYPCRLAAIFDLKKINSFDNAMKIENNINTVWRSNEDDESMITYCRKFKLIELQKKSC